MKKPLSLQTYLLACEDMDPAFLGEKFLGLLRWQVSKGQTVFHNGGWYLRLIYRDWQVEQNLREKSAQPRKTPGMSPMRELIETALNVQG